MNTDPKERKRRQRAVEITEKRVMIFFLFFFPPNLSFRVQESEYFTFGLQQRLFDVEEKRLVGRGKEK